MTAALRLDHGQFIGESGCTARAAGFSFAEIVHHANVSVPLHTHDDAHFMLILRGEYHSSARSVDGHVGSPRLIFNPPGTTHRDQFRSATGLFFTMSMRPAQFARLADGTHGVTHAVAFGAGCLSAIAAHMWREVRHLDALSDVVLEGLALELLGRAGRRFSRGRGRRRPAWLNTAMDLMRNQCCTPIKVSDIAQEVGVHPYHLTRTVRAFAGRSPGALLREFRIERSATMLADSDRRIADIAIECGFADQSQFTRSFRRARGTTPTAFRREVRSVPRALRHDLLRSDKTG